MFPTASQQACFRAPYTFAKKAPADAWLAKTKADVDAGAWLHPDDDAERMVRPAAEKAPDHPGWPHAELVPLVLATAAVRPRRVTPTS